MFFASVRSLVQSASLRRGTRVTSFAAWDTAAPEEAGLAAGLLGGSVSRAAYQDAMARLAASDDSADLAMSLWQATGRSDRAQLTMSVNKLVVRWPDVPPATLTLALALAFSGYRTDDLTSLLHLSRLQARTVIIAADT